MRTNATYNQNTTDKSKPHRRPLCSSRGTSWNRSFQSARGSHTQFSSYQATAFWTPGETYTNT